MSIGERLAGLADGEITVEDVDTLFDRLAQDLPTAMEAAGHLETVADRFPELVHRRRDRLPAALDAVEQREGHRSYHAELYAVAHELVQRDPTFATALFPAIEEHADIPYSPVRLHVAELLATAAENGVDVPQSVLDRFAEGVVEDPDRTPTAAAVRALVVLATTGHAPSGNGSALASLVQRHADDLGARDGIDTSAERVGTAVERLDDAG